MSTHVSVLKEETVRLLNPKDGGIYVDATLGRAGHASYLLSQYAGGHLYAFDKDSTAIEESKVVLKDQLDRVTFIHNDFANLKEELQKLSVNEVDGVMMDLGVSSPQFDDASRGFSYRFDARLDMRMDVDQKLSAYEVVNTYSLEALTKIFRDYGEERYALPIARAIAQTRSTSPIETTFQLNEVVKNALPQRELNKKGHPCKKVYQAIRIEVNHELDSLKDGLKQACDLLKVNGRCAVITFHSLEDRMVKTYFKDISTAPFVDPRIPLTVNQMEQASFSVITKHPLVAGSEEMNENHRAHSAKLRAIERIRNEQ